MYCMWAVVTVLSPCTVWHSTQCAAKLPARRALHNSLTLCIRCIRSLLAQSLSLWTVNVSMCFLLRRFVAEVENVSEWETVSIKMYRPVARDDLGTDICQTLKLTYQLWTDWKPLGFQIAIRVIPRCSSSAEVRTFQLSLYRMWLCTLYRLWVSFLFVFKI